MGNIYTISHFLTQKIKISHLIPNELQVLANIFGLDYNLNAKNLINQSFMLKIIEYIAK